jgi:hypothetical protein
MCISIFCTNYFRNIFHSKEKWARYVQKGVLNFMSNIRYSCQILIEIEFSQQTFKKYWNIKFRENPFSGTRVVQCGRTDIHETKQIVDLRNFSRYSLKRLGVGLGWPSSRRVPGSIPGHWGFFFGASDSSMCPGVESASKNEYQDIPGDKDGRCVRVTTLPPSRAECLEILEL